MPHDNKEGIAPDGQTAVATAMERELMPKELTAAANYLATELRIALKRAPETGRALTSKYLNNRVVIGLDTIAMVQQPIHFNRKGLFYTVHYPPPDYYTTYNIQRGNAKDVENLLIKIGRSDLDTIIEHKQRLPDGNFEVHRNTPTARDRANEFIATF